MCFDWIMALLKLPVFTAKDVVERLHLEAKRANHFGKVQRADEADRPVAARQSLPPFGATRRPDRHRYDVAIEREVVICSHTPL